MAALGRAPEFQLKDQFDAMRVIRYPLDRAAVFCLSDQGGIDHAENWIRPLQEQYKERVDIIGVGVLSAVPALFKAVALGIIRDRLKHPCLLDWDGSVSQEFGFEAGQVNVYVIARNGDILTKQTGISSPAALDQLCVSIDVALTPEKHV